MSIFPTKILLATDGSREADLAAKSAVELAQRTGSELEVVHVFGISPWYPAYPETNDLEGVELEDLTLEEALERISEQRAREVLDAEVEKVRSAGGTVAQAHLREGGIAQEIVALAEDIGAGVVVMGSRGHGGIRRALMGGVSEAVVRHAHCPVLVVRADPIVFPAKILVATDGSKEAELASSSAADLAKRTGSELHLVHVGHIPTVFYESPGGLGTRPGSAEQDGGARRARGQDETRRAGAAGKGGRGRGSAGARETR
jgi:nucleotide-binding universal stress UspA family protein